VRILFTMKLFLASIISARESYFVKNNKRNVYGSKDLYLKSKQDILMLRK